MLCFKLYSKVFLSIVQRSHFKDLRKLVEGGGLRPVVMAFYGVCFFPAVEFYRLMMMMMAIGTGLNNKYSAYGYFVSSSSDKLPLP